MDAKKPGGKPGIFACLLKIAIASLLLFLGSLLGCLLDCLLRRLLGRSFLLCCLLGLSAAFLAGAFFAAFLTANFLPRFVILPARFGAADFFATFPPFAPAVFLADFFAAFFAGAFLAAFLLPSWLLS